MKPHIARRLLKVTSYASCSEIKKAWKREMLIHHPDRHENSKHKVQYCRALNQAKNILLSTDDTQPHKRKNIYTPFDTVEEEYLFWESIIK